MALRFRAGSLHPAWVVTPADALGKGSPAVPADCTGCEHVGSARRSEAYRYLCEACLRARHGAVLNPPPADPPGRPFVHRARDRQEALTLSLTWPAPANIRTIDPRMMPEPLVRNAAQLVAQSSRAGWTAVSGRLATVTLSFRGKPGKTGELLSVLLNRREAWRIVCWVDGSFSGAKVWGDIHPTIVNEWKSIKELMT